MAGSISLSLSQQFDSDGRPLSGGLLYFYQAGTSTPQSAYQDSGLTIAWPNPITLDASGRVPSFFLANGNIKIRLTDTTGATVIAADNLLVVGASSGSGGSVAVDATTVLQTGDVKSRYGTGTHSGWVRCNSRTIGSATSGATERANSDCQALFQHLWAADSNLSVSTGRGSSAAADWSANKTIALPDFRGCVLAGMDDMGASAANVLTVGGSGVDGTTLGAGAGTESKVLLIEHLPAHTHSFSASPTSGVDSIDHIHSGTTSAGSSHTHTLPNFDTVGATLTAGPTSVWISGLGGHVTTSGESSHTHPMTTGGESANHTHSVPVSGVSGSTGSATAFSRVQPTKVITIYMKL